MRLPILSEVQNPSKKYSVLFRGLNLGEYTQDGEFAHTHNLSSEKYPCISQRATRIKEGDWESPSSIHTKGELLVIDGTKVFYGGKEIEGAAVKEGKKQMATIGDYIVIFPDKKYYKVPTEDENGEMQEGEFGSMEEEFEDTLLVFTSSTISIGTEYKAEKLHFEGSTISKEGANFPFKAGDVVSIAGCSPAWKENNKSNITITEATSDVLTFDDVEFILYTATSEATITLISRKTERKFQFKKGDAVTIKGCSTDENNKEKEIIIKDVTDTELTFDDDTFTAATEIGTEENPIIIKRNVPELEFVCESNYRLWGTKGNIIFSSKSDDPFNFFVFEGLSSDSYNIEVNSDGPFTGCIPYSSYICFFKENTLHKLYGTKPSNFQITTANVYGVQSGCERSMHIVNEQLLYKGVNGVYAYTGGVPELISEKFGTTRFSDAVATCDGNRYYISMKCNLDNNWNLFVYDVLRDIWLREDDTHALDMTFHDGKVYFIDAGGELFYIDQEAKRDEIEWSATFCTMHETINEKKGYSKFSLRMDLAERAYLAVDIKTNNDNQWRQIYSTYNEKAKTLNIPIIPTRCDSIDIRLRGKGECTVHSFIREFRTGSDM